MLFNFSGHDGALVVWNVQSGQELRRLNITFGFMYHFFDNSTTVYEEYLIYDAISMIGSVGGTLGMCIGFSFTGMISSLMNILRHVLMTIKLKSKTQNDNMEIK